MKALFLYSLNDIYLPEKPLRSPEQIQFGISYISSFLKQHGHRTDLAVLSRILGSRNEKMLEDHVRRFAPDVIFCTAVSTEYPFVLRMARFLKKRFPSLYIVLGGVHATLDPENAFDPAFDALCVGEGEYASLELVRQLEKGSSPSGIPGLLFRSGGRVERTAPAPFLEGLDELPYPDRDMWQPWIADDEHAYHPVLLGRGCPFGCTYCCNHALRKVTSGKYVRMRSPEAIVGEVADLAERYPERTNFYLEVETIACDRAWALDLCGRLARLNASRTPKLSFGVNMRITPRAVPDELFASMQRGNFTFINVGLESGSERVRREVLHRNYSNDDVVRVVMAARRHGLKVNFYNLIGVPGETRNDFRETIEINRRCRPDKTFPHIFYPYPGTELYATCKARGLLVDGLSCELERALASLDMEEFSRREIQDSYIWFRYHVYEGRKPWPSRLAQAMLDRCLSHVLLHRMYRRATFLARSVQGTSNNRKGKGVSK